MDTAVITGSAGLVGSEAVRYFDAKGFRCIGIDNDMRRYFFGEEASTASSRQRLEEDLPHYVHQAVDIRNQDALASIFSEYGSDIRVVVHTAAQPSHDWAARDPLVDFGVNANGTLNLLEATRRHCPEAVFIFTSTNKVYGDLPNGLPLEERETRWEVAEGHPFAAEGIDETMPIDRCKHSIFGASKVAADVMVQEYGRYFGMKTACFRGGCLTGPGHAGAELHGFLSYLVKCAITGRPYTVYGYKGKQVRDNMHARDLVRMFWAFYQAPRVAEVYNAGGSRHSNCSMIEAFALCEKLFGKRMDYCLTEDNRIGDHIWYISDVRKFRSHYPEWDYEYSIEEILREIGNAVEGTEV